MGHEPTNFARRDPEGLTVGRLQQLHQAGVAIWLDSLSRDLLESGEFERMIREFAVTGATSNPTIFAKAITTSDRYDGQLRQLQAEGIDDPQALFFALALDDVAGAAALLRPTYDRSQGQDGFVSFECTPDLADDADATVEQAHELWEQLHLPNVLIKVPATPAGVVAIEELTARGVNVNVTLLFAHDRYEEVIEAYLTGLERRVAAGGELGDLTSVASFFVSRVDTEADAVLAPDSPLRGQIAVANAVRAYHLYRTRFAGSRWQRLRALGANPQRPLWASTGVKNPDYYDLVYVERLIAPGVINTMPETTLFTFRDHGSVVAPIDPDPGEAERILAAAAKSGLDLDAITHELERAGVESFCRSYGELLRCIETKLAAISGHAAVSS
jgi:transaldolase